MMKFRKPMAALLASMGLLSAGAAMPAPAPQTSPVPHFVFFTVRNNLLSRPSPQPELLEAPLDLDLRQVRPREALQRIFARTGQAYVIDGRFDKNKRITLLGAGMPLFEALDQFVHQAGGSWIQERRGDKAVIRIGPGLSGMTGHLGPLVLPRDQRFLDQVNALRRAQPGAEPAETEKDKGR